MLALSPQQGARSPGLPPPTHTRLSALQLDYTIIFLYLHHTKCKPGKKVNL